MKPQELQQLITKAIWETDASFNTIMTVLNQVQNDYIELWDAIYDENKYYKDRHKTSDAESHV